MLIRSGTARRSVLTLADDLVRQAGSPGLLRWGVSDFQRIPGIGKVKALQLSTFVEIAKRMMRGERTKGLIFETPAVVWEYLCGSTARFGGTSLGDVPRSEKQIDSG